MSVVETYGEPSSSRIYQDDHELPDRMFIYANNAAEMAEALRCIASEVLRLSRSPNSEKQKPSLPLGIKEV